MQINKLYYFVCVAKYLNFTKAAEECHLAQSAMSQQINSLEKELGFKLFIRTSRSVTLTESGKVFYENIKGVIDDYNSAVKKAESAAYGYKGTLTIGVCGGVEEKILPRIVKNFKKEYPFIEVRFNKATYEDIPKELSDGTYDVVFTWPYDIEDIKDIKYKIVFKDTVCAMMNFANPLALKRSITRLEASRENNIVICNNKNSKTYKHFCTFYSHEDFETIRIQTVPDDNILRLLIDLNMGISIVPKSLKESFCNDFAFVNIEGKQHEMAYCLAYTKVSSNPCLKLFIDKLDF